jgi:hypothetical protein
MVINGKASPSTWLDMAALCCEPTIVLWRLMTMISANYTRVTSYHVSYHMEHWTCTSTGRMPSCTHHVLAGSALEEGLDWGLSTASPLPTTPQPAMTGAAGSTPDSRVKGSPGESPGLGGAAAGGLKRGVNKSVACYAVLRGQGSGGDDSKPRAASLLLACCYLHNGWGCQMVAPSSWGSPTQCTSLCHLVSCS